MMAKLPAGQFDCPACGAHYKVVSVETETPAEDVGLGCRHCGAPLRGRDGLFIFKYFLVGRPLAEQRPIA